MADQTAIEWCDSTFNPWIGCTRVSPACDDCYAARSTPARTLGVAWGPGQQRRRTAASTWGQVRTWQKHADDFKYRHGRRRRVFCASLADWLDNEVPIQWLVDLLELVRSTPDLDWLLLSKRIGNWSSRISEAIGFLDEQTPAAYPLPLRAWLCHWLDGDEAPRNVWMLATICNQTEAQRDIIKLLRVPAVVHGLSIEPMLGPIDLERPRPGPDLDQGGGQMICQPWLIQSGIDWVICGGESGPKARPMHPDWARSLRDQCAAAGVPFLFKQWGEWRTPVDDERFNTAMGRAQATPAFIVAPEGTVHCFENERTAAGGKAMLRVGKKATGRLLDGRTYDEWPEVRHG